MTSATTTDLAPSPADGTLGQRLSRQLLIRPEAPTLTILIILCLVLAVTVPSFRTLENVEAVLDQACVLGVLAMAMTLVVIAGEIDISVGSLTAVCAFGAVLVAQHTGGLLLPLIAAMGIGVVVGTINGFLVTVGRIPSIIVTIAVLFILRGLLLVSQSAAVLTAPGQLTSFGAGSLLGVRNSIWLLLGSFVVFTLVLRQSTWGRNIYAVGGNRRAANLVGLPIRRIRWLTFIALGAATGFAAVILVGQNGQLQATVATGLELQVVAAVVVGGTSITGGTGSAAAALTGALFIGVVNDAMTLTGVPASWQNVVLGALILIAVASSALRQRALHRFVGLGAPR